MGKLICENKMDFMKAYQRRNTFTTLLKVQKSRNSIMKFSAYSRTALVKQNTRCQRYFVPGVYSDCQWVSDGSQMGLKMGLRMNLEF